nr:MAG TPA: Protein of unknown function (DUF3135) [Caudoviricetes sp.]
MSRNVDPVSQRQLMQSYQQDIEMYEQERDELLKRIRADTATPAERSRYNALGWKIEAVRQRMDKRYRDGVAEPIKIMQ